MEIKAAEMETPIDEADDAEMQRLREICPGCTNMKWIDEEDPPDPVDNQDVLEHSQVSEKDRPEFGPKRRIIGCE